MAIAEKRVKSREIVGDVRNTLIRSSGVFGGARLFINEMRRNGIQEPSVYPKIAAKKEEGKLPGERLAKELSDLKKEFENEGLKQLKALLGSQKNLDEHRNNIERMLDELNEIKKSYGHEELGIFEKKIDDHIRRHTNLLDALALFKLEGKMKDFKGTVDYDALFDMEKELHKMKSEAGRVPETVEKDFLKDIDRLVEFERDIMNQKAGSEDFLDPSAVLEDIYMKKGIERKFSPEEANEIIKSSPFHRSLFVKELAERQRYLKEMK